MQARRQDRVTRGAEINFGGAREVYLREFKSVEQTKKAKTNKKRSSVQKFSQTLVFISKFCDSTNPKVKTKKKGLRPQSFMKSGMGPQKLQKKRFLHANSKAISTNLDVLGRYALQ